VNVPATIESAIPKLQRLTMGNVPIDVVTFAGALEHIEALVRAKRGGTVFTPNIDHVVLAESDARLRAAYADVSLSLVDGTPLLWASRLLGTTLPEKISGSDLVLPLLRLAADKGFRVYFLGGAEGVAAKAAGILQRDMPGIQIAGWSSPRVALNGDANSYRAVIDDVRAHTPDLLLVALGCPKQEHFMLAARPELGAVVSVGVGASLDFVAGTVKRAPRWMSRTGLEWAFRLGQEPKRLWRRYLIQDPKFLGILARDLKARGFRPRPPK
jgi:N-acetylglucosaminyldiphosphoundecaprenol N-acetyl-beta-D-mannosaminyltransferase